MAVGTGKVFPRDWLISAVPVFFDFGNAPALTEVTTENDGSLWCLLPGRILGLAVVLRVSRRVFIDAIHTKVQPLMVRVFLDNVRNKLASALGRLERENQARARAAEMLTHRCPGWRSSRAPRRYAKF